MKGPAFWRRPELALLILLLLPFGLPLRARAAATNPDDAPQPAICRERPCYAGAWVDRSYGHILEGFLNSRIDADIISADLAGVSARTTDTVVPILQRGDADSHRSVFVQVRVNNSAPSWFVFDTGAQIVMRPHDVFEKLKRSGHITSRTPITCATSG